MAEKLNETDPPERRSESVDAPQPGAASEGRPLSRTDAWKRVNDEVRGQYLASIDASRSGDSKVERSEKIHSRYPDGLAVREGEQPSKVRGPDPAAGGSPHTVLKMDEVNNRVYKAREYGDGGVPVRDIDFTHPTYPNGRPRPHHTAPEQHRYVPNDPDNPKAGYRRGPGEPLGS